MAKRDPSEVFDLKTLPQSTVAWVTGKTPYWLRQNSHLFERNADGTYDARVVFSALAAASAKVVFARDEWADLVAKTRDPKNCPNCRNGLVQDCEFHDPDGTWAPKLSGEELVAELEAYEEGLVLDE